MSGTQKAHISLSEASRLTGYSAEYLRQLCVKSKVHGQKVGKTWIISQEEVQKLDPTVVSEASRLTGYSAEYLRQLCVKSKVHGQKVGKTWIISQEEVQKLDPTVASK